MQWRLPINGLVLARFYAHLYNGGLTNAIIMNYVSAIGFFHKFGKFSDPSTHFTSGNCCRGLEIGEQKVDHCYQSINVC